MKRERDVLDYAALGLSAAQAYKLTEIASEVGKLREVAADERREARRLSQMRQMVLMTEELLERLESDTNFTETGVQRQFTMAYEMEANLKLAGILPPMEFESWEDKERVGRLEKRIDGFRARLLVTLPEQQRADAERCIEYMAEEPDLKRLIMAKDRGTSFLRMAELAGDKIDVKDLTKKFEGVEDIDKLRLMYAERRAFVRGIIGPQYLAHQDAEEEEEEPKDQPYDPLPWTHPKPLTVGQSIERGVALVIIGIVATAVLVVVVMLFTH